MKHAMAETKNLPTNHLAPALQRQLLDAIQGAFSIAEERRLISLTTSTMRTEIVLKAQALGKSLTRPECDQILKDLALVVPRAGLGPDEIERMLDLYLGLFREAGITAGMLQQASKEFVMAPRKGKPRFFPDPGELAELCADAARNRMKALKAYRAALEVIDGKKAGSAQDEPVFDARARIKDLDAGEMSDEADVQGDYVLVPANRPKWPGLRSDQRFAPTPDGSMILKISELDKAQKAALGLN